jgi:pectin methylesterase-like acyl-CoA thioesterase
MFLKASPVEIKPPRFSGEAWRSNSSGKTSFYVLLRTVCICAFLLSGLAFPARASLNAVSLFPPNGATNVCPDTHLQITFDAIPAVITNGQVIIYTAASVPVDTNDLSLGLTQTRKIGPPTPANYVVYPVIVNGNTATIYPHTGVLTNNQTYYVTITAGTFTNTSSGAFAGISDANTWRFITKPSPPLAGTNELVVAADDSGDFATVQGALNFLPSGNSQHVLIFIRNGIYQEVIYVNGKGNLTFRGEDRKQTVISYPNNNNLNPGGSSVRTMINVNADDNAMENLTLSNSTPHGGSQAEALRVSGHRFILNNADLDSFQDTFLINSMGHYAYIYNCHVQGDTDFIWNDGTVVFQSCEIEAMNAGYNCQMRTSASSYYGAVFLDCSLTKAYNFTGHYLNRIDPNVYPYSAAAYINCRMDTHITPAGWLLNNLTSTSPTNQLRFWEYQSTDLNGNPLDVSRRIAPSIQLNAVQAVSLRNLTNVLFGWLPQLAPNIIGQPTNETVAAGGNATFAVGATGIETADPVAEGGASSIIPLNYQWLKNGAPLTDATNSTLTITNAQRSDLATYSVVVTNLSGSVTSSVVALAVTGLNAGFIGETTGADGSFILNFAGLPNTAYSLETATNLSPPVNWLPIATNTTDAEGLWQFTDSQTTNDPVRFYRAVQQ